MSPAALSTAMVERPDPRRFHQCDRRRALGRDKIAALGRRLQKLRRPVLDHLVRLGDARLAISEFEQGMDEEGLDHLALLVRVLEHVPRIGAIPLSLEADVLHHGEEGAALRRVDQIVDDRRGSVPHRPRPDWRRKARASASTGSDPALRSFAASTPM